MFKNATTGLMATLFLSAAIALPSFAAEVKEPKPKVTLEKAGREQLDKLLQTRHGKVVLVDFWATWCSPCKQMFTNTVALYGKYHDQGLDVISVSFDEPEEQQPALEFLQTQGAVFTNLISEDGFDSTDTFEIDSGALPHYRLYDRSGKLVQKFVSGDPKAVFKESQVEAAIKSLLAK